MRVNDVSRAIKMLKSEGLVICVNEDAHIGRMYEQTIKGQKVDNYFRKK
ncbi:MAG: hypothetical protein ACRC1M_04935 [Methanobacteriaceae archaeon]